MDLRFRLYAAVHKAECRDRPAQVIAFPIALAQGEFFAQGGLVDLNDLQPVRFEVKHFFTDRQRDLQRAFAERNVLAGEGPVQDGDGAGQHALHRLFGQALRIDRPFDRHRLIARNIAPDDGRLYATRTVGLHPRLFSE